MKLVINVCVLGGDRWESTDRLEIYCVRAGQIARPMPIGYVRACKTSQARPVFLIAYSNL